ncbi:MAG TPA: hypothetical protein VLH60_02980, partial [Sedimentisphaerales bacterium]|nr:hypothetical protein [Sedimentisphaerales bacterium]
MFEIDLLNGEGRPVKSQPWAIALVTAPLIIPLAAIAFLIGSYVTAGIEIRSLNNRAASIDTRLADMTDAKRQRNTAQAQILSAAKSSGEIAELIKGQMQWSDVISEISNLVPGSVVLNRITASRERILLRPDDSGAPRTEYKFTIMMGAYD